MKLPTAWPVTGPGFPCRAAAQAGKSLQPPIRSKLAQFVLHTWPGAQRLCMAPSPRPGKRTGRCCRPPLPGWLTKSRRLRGRAPPHKAAPHLAGCCAERGWPSCCRTRAAGATRTASPEQVRQVVQECLFILYASAPPFADVVRVTKGHAQRGEPALAGRPAVAPDFVPELVHSRRRHRPVASFGQHCTRASCRHWTDAGSDEVKVLPGSPRYASSSSPACNSAAARSRPSCWPSRGSGHRPVRTGGRSRMHPTSSRLKAARRTSARTVEGRGPPGVACAGGQSATLYRI